MSRKIELAKKVDEYCESKDDECTGCIFANNNKYCNYSNLSEEDLEIAVKLINETGFHDNVNHPSHYNREGAMETIDEMIELFGIEQTMAFCKLSAWKYRARALRKNGEEDMKKSDWFVRKYAELKVRLKLEGTHIGQNI